MTAQEASAIYQRTLSESALLLRGGDGGGEDERAVIDVTPNPPEPSGEDAS